jgi:hypothetical protein
VRGGTRQCKGYSWFCRAALLSKYSLIGEITRSKLLWSHYRFAV